MDKSVHNKIINQVAKRILKPAGLIQKGQSRTWLDDNIWFTTILEYQPSSWSKGSYLNIGINFNWYVQEHFSFDYGYRESHFINFKGEEQFSEHMIEITNSGLSKIQQYRKFLDVNYAKNVILSHKFHSDELWGNYHRAMICFITGDYDKFQFYCEMLSNLSTEVGWIQELKNNVENLKSISKDRNEIINYISALIMKTRQPKKLPAIESEKVQAIIASFIH